MTSTHVTPVNEKNFEAEVMKADKLVLIDFYADWCGPCKSMAPRLEEFAGENTGVKVVKINVDESRNLAALFQIRSIPTLVTMKDGAAILGVVGALPKSGIEQLITKSLENLKANPSSKPPQQPNDPAP